MADETTFDTLDDSPLAAIQEEVQAGILFFSDVPADEETSEK